jgi:hypothetical protein
MRLKILASTIVFLILSYSFFWYYMAGEVEDRIEVWVSEQKSQGLSIRYDNLEINGFPYRMELSLNGLKVIKTGRGELPVLMTSPHITLVAFPWKINHGILISDGGSVRIGSRRRPAFAMTFGKSRASVVIDLASRTFQRASVVSEKITWSTGRIKPSEAQQVKLHIMRPAPSAELESMELPVQMKLYLEAKDVIAQEIPVGIFGKKADRVKIDLQLHGQGMPAYSKERLSAWRDNGGTLAVKNFEVTSGKMNIDLNGEVTLDSDMKPLGTFAAKVRGIDHMVEILSGHSAFQKEPGNVILQELDRMNRPEEKGGKKVLDLAISLQGGLLFLGPIPVYELGPVVE